MIDNPPTFTAAELAALETSLVQLADAIFASPEWAANTALGALAESDDLAIRNVARIVRRLSLDLKYPRGSRATSYLPAPVPVAEPQSLRVQS